MTRFQLVKFGSLAVQEEKIFGLDGDAQPAAAGHRLVVRAHFGCPY